MWRSLKCLVGLHGKPWTLIWKGRRRSKRVARYLCNECRREFERARPPSSSAQW